MGYRALVIPVSREVDEILMKVLSRKAITINSIREILSKRHGATIGCPITTGIFARVTANAAKEGEKNIAPYWRILKSNGESNAKYPVVWLGGQDF